MTENRYYEKEWEESYYIFDSNTISEDEFEERVEYEGYDVFKDSLTGYEVIDLLNENEELKKENNKWIVDYNGLNGEYEWLKEENEQLKSVNMEYEDALGRLEEETEQLKQTIKTICKDYENHHGMDIRNAEWFTAW